MDDDYCTILLWHTRGRHSRKASVRLCTKSSKTSVKLCAVFQKPRHCCLQLLLTMHHAKGCHWLRGRWDDICKGMSLVERQVRWCVQRDVIGWEGGGMIYAKGCHWLRGRWNDVCKGMSLVEGEVGWCMQRDGIGWGAGGMMCACEQYKY